MQQDLIWPGAMSAGLVFLSVLDGSFHAVYCHCDMTHMNAMDIDCTFPWTLPKGHLNKVSASAQSTIHLLLVEEPCCHASLASYDKILVEKIKGCPVDH